MPNRKLVVASPAKLFAPAEAMVTALPVERKDKDGVDDIGVTFPFPVGYLQLNMLKMTQYFTGKRTRTKDDNG